MGLGDWRKSDQMAVETLRSAMDSVGMDGTIVIGEGERDKAPTLFIGEKVGAAVRDKSHKYPEVDIAVDPLEGTNLCATGEPNAIVVLAASERGGLLHAPDLYMEKIIVGPSCKGAVEIDATGRAQSARNCQAARSRRRRISWSSFSTARATEAHSGHSQDRREDSTYFRRRPLRRDQRSGDRHGSSRCDGQGGAPEGVLTAAALRCLNGEIQARLVVSKPEHHERMEKMGITIEPHLRDGGPRPGQANHIRVYGRDGRNLLGGVRFFGEGVRTHSLILTHEDAQVRFVDTVHLESRPDVKVRFFSES